MPKKFDSSEFARRLGEERRRLELSQTDFAALGGVAKQTVVAYEKGSRRPDVEFLTDVMDAGVDLQYLVSGMRAGARVMQDVDWQLLGAIFAGLEEACRALNLRIKAEKRSELIRVLYTHFAAHRAVDTEELQRILILAAA